MKPAAIKLRIAETGAVIAGDPKGNISFRTDIWNETTDRWNKLGKGFTYVFGSRAAALAILPQFFPTATIE